MEEGQYLCDQCRDEEGGALTRPPRASELEERSRHWPTWMPRPSPVQYHATIMGAVFAVLVGLGAFAFLSHHGVGPFTARWSPVARASTLGYPVMVRVTNEGSKTSRANCQVIGLSASRSPRDTRTVLTPEIPPGETISFRVVLRDPDNEIARVKAGCV